ncbi:hypothetical protein PRZ48_009879 [Zasmidium cellare]|uniref:O-methyltransferase n=1 Tax=Zasmidium cellare TaxID=395010 RepID=A0ABR0ECZ0_ZASCE|nr:hypothetical protein PRZ48_009879 [Zasmidium cellare]
MTSTEALIETLNTTDKSIFHGDEISRMKAARAARKLAQRLEAPWERMYTEIINKSSELVSVKTCTDVKLWSCLSSTPQTSAHLAEKTGMDQGLLRRMLRVLVTMDFVEEADVDTYVETEMSKELRDPDGMILGLDMYYSLSLKMTQLLPEYFKRHGYRIPEDISQAPFKWAMGMPEYKDGFWAMIDEIGLSPKFNGFLSGLRRGQPSWAALWPVEEKLLEGWDGKSVLLVDIGGGKGRDICNLAEVIHENHANARLVLQDRPSVLEEARASGLHPQIETMPHDFFKPNPVHGARAYFEHSVVHDWPDKEAREILTQIKNSMQSGYSKLLLMERVMPESAKEVDPNLASIDLHMAFNFCAQERTEVQWRALLQSVGLKYVGYQPVFGKTYILEAELP